MLKNKFTRHTISFLAIALASVCLYPIAQTEMATFTWLLLGLILAAALITLTTK